MRRRCGVYFIINVVNGKHYVGSSINIDRRWSNHISVMRRSQPKCVKLYRAWHKYGERSFYFGVLEETNEENLHCREEYWIERLRAARDGMNTFARPGWVKPPSQQMISAMTGRRHSMETRKKMSAAQKGRPKSADHIAKVAAALLGRKFSAERREKAILASRNRTPAQMAKLAEVNRRNAKKKVGLPRPQIVKERVSAGLRAYWSKQRERAPA